MYWNMELMSVEQWSNKTAKYKTSSLIFKWFILRTFVLLVILSTLYYITQWCCIKPHSPKYFRIRRETGNSKILERCINLLHVSWFHLRSCKYLISLWNNDPTKQQNTKPHLLYLCVDNHYCMGLLIYHINQVLRKLLLLMIRRQWSTSFTWLDTWYLVVLLEEPN
jgi:hypothetical protein